MCIRYCYPDISQRSYGRGYGEESELGRPHRILPGEGKGYPLQYSGLESDATERLSLHFTQGPAQLFYFFLGHIIFWESLSSKPLIVKAFFVIVNSLCPIFCQSQIYMYSIDFFFFYFCCIFCYFYQSFCTNNETNIQLSTSIPCMKDKLFTIFNIQVKKFI